MIFIVIPNFVEAHNRKGRLADLQKYGVVPGVTAASTGSPSSTSAKQGLERARKASCIWRKFSKRKVKEDR